MTLDINSTDIDISLLCICDDCEHHYTVPGVVEVMACQGKNAVQVQRIDFKIRDPYLL